MGDWLAGAALKLAGSASGSAVAVWFRRGGDTLGRLFFRWLAGTWVGYVAAGWLSDYMGWPASPDYALLAASVMGVTGYAILQLVLGPEIKAWAKTVIKSRIEKTP